MSWNEIDHEMVRHKLSLVAQEMQPKVVSEERRVLFECRQKGNAGAIKPSLVGMHERLTDEWIERTYQAYCEVWSAQRQIKSADFVRAVFQNAIIPLIAVRQATIIAHFNLMATRKREHSSRPENDALVRALKKLQGKWLDKLEVEARSCTYLPISQESQPSPPPRAGAKLQPARQQVIPGTSMPPQSNDYVSVWGQIDHTLVSLKTQEPLNEHIASIDEERRKTEWNHRENQHACAAAILEMAERRADEWMGIRVGIYCEVWKLQNKVPNADFFRTLRDNIVEPVVHAKVNGERDGLIRKWERCGLPFRQGLDALLTRFGQVMIMLEHKWKTKLEIGAREWRLANPPLAAEPESDEPSGESPQSAQLGRAGISHRRAAGKRSGLQYRSELKRAILVQLTKRPDSSGLEVCRALDADGAADLPANWSSGGNRLFEKAYMHRSIKNRIHSVISKIRADLRKNGLWD
jgi:hypothetical protein